MQTTNPTADDLRTLIAEKDDVLHPLREKIANARADAKAAGADNNRARQNALDKDADALERKAERLEEERAELNTDLTVLLMKAELARKTARVEKASTDLDAAQVAFRSTPAAVEAVVRDFLPMVMPLVDELNDRRTDADQAEHMLHDAKGYTTIIHQTATDRYIAKNHPGLEVVVRALVEYSKKR